MLPDLRGTAGAFGCAPEPGTTCCGLNRFSDALQSSFVIIDDRRNASNDAGFALKRA
tara:strand:- start:246 stop:416 length:171 start_codon:yes stop_codon:yes gene_type:complete